MSGKWHLGQDNGTAPWQRGFDRVAEPARRRHVLSEPELTRAATTPLTSRAQEPLFLNGTATPRDADVFGKNWYATYLWPSSD